MNVIHTFKDFSENEESRIENTKNVIKKDLYLYCIFFM